MNARFPLPQSIRQDLACPAMPGARHSQMVRLSLAMLNARLTTQAVFVQLRSMYGSDIPDVEIQRVISWAQSKIEPRTSFVQEPYEPLKDKEPPAAAIHRFLRDFRCAEADVWEASPVRLPEDWRMDWALFLETIFEPTDCINVVTHYRIERGKALPAGKGQTMNRDSWLADARVNGVPPTPAGGWVRVNPMAGKGVADSDVGCFRFALVEMDNAPIPLQISLLAKLPLPINALVCSGGRSIHAWVRVEAPNLELYRSQTARLLSLLAPFGVDPANRNPSRLARLPGGDRQIGSSEDRRQRLLYLSPSNRHSTAIL